MNPDCVYFLQWALPKLGMKWSGFRKVRKQVCKRIKRRMQELDLGDWSEYRDYLEINKREWKLLDGYCRITISRFYRDHFLFEYLADEILPKLIRNFQDEDGINCISLGSASGEEPYTIAILWKHLVSNLSPNIGLSITGVDMDPVLLERARIAKYPMGSLWELPDELRKKAFLYKVGYCQLKAHYKEKVEFIQADIRNFVFRNVYHLVCCRNIAATYFSDDLKVSIFEKIRNAMPLGAALVLGSHEQLPDHVTGFRVDQKLKYVYWRA